MNLYTCCQRQDGSAWESPIIVASGSLDNQHGFAGWPGKHRFTSSAHQILNFSHQIWNFMEDRIPFKRIICTLEVLSLDIIDLVGISNTSSIYVTKFNYV